ncbi:MAG: primosomal protein N' [Gammaproteobacteria bacterium]|nr:primosomal protein N' [Gammaproteobacteria bacterium]
MNILKVAINVPLPTLFDYLPPLKSKIEQLKPGIRLEVPFGRRTMVGILLNVESETSLEIKKLKAAKLLIDSEPILPRELIELGKWISNYYHYPIGETLFNILPKLLRDGDLPAEIKDKTEPTKNKKIVEEKIPILNKHQNEAVKTIQSTQNFKPFLLDGVTGSGKTEVYLNAIESVLNQNKSALVLVPEISLTPQTIARFTERFKQDIAILHSRLTNKERAENWQRAKGGIAKIVIGTRSAIFTPMSNLGIIIIDEEHDLSFKQQSGLLYSAKNVGVMRAKLLDIPIILGSATPSLESVHNAEKNKYVKLHLPERAGKAVHPSINLIDMRNNAAKHGLSNKLTAQIKEHIARKGQVLIFINRRGYAPTLMCKNCGWSAECTNCDARMTLHMQPKYLHCHHCDKTIKVYKECPKCHSTKLSPSGFGTERIEEGLETLFPDTKIVRIDRDTTKTKGKINKIVADINNQNYQILIGTQMLAKGHDFPNVTLAAILNADGGLFSSDFRAEEYTAQLITQVSGRAGRAERPGEVYIQTYNPEHPLLIQLIQNGYQAFAQDALRERKEALLPPFSHWCLIRSRSNKQELALQFLENVKTLAEPYLTENIQVLGPITPPMARRAKQYHAQLLISSPNRNTLHKLLDKLIPSIKPPSNLHYSVDIDPVDML